MNVPFVLQDDATSEVIPWFLNGSLSEVERNAMAPRIAFSRLGRSEAEWLGVVRASLLREPTAFDVDAGIARLMASMQD